MKRGMRGGMSIVNSIGMLEKRRIMRDISNVRRCRRERSHAKGMNVTNVTKTKVKRGGRVFGRRTTFGGKCNSEGGGRGWMITMKRWDTIKIIKRANIVIINASDMGTKVSFLSGTKS